jgi:hypothetical protein
MPKSLKNIFAFFIVCCLLAFHQNALAWRKADSVSQTGNLNDYATADTANSASADDNVNTGSEHDEAAAESSDDTYQDEDYKASNFDKATTPPSQVKRNWNDQKWEQITQNPDFHYDDVKEDKPDKPKDYSNSWWVRFIKAIVNFFASTAGKFVVISAVVIIVLVIIARVIQLQGNVFFSKKDKKTGTTDDENADDYIPENWDTEIAAAANAGNYRLALRHCYRYLLTSLSEKELIQFQVAKTNYQYVYELSGTAFHQPFMKLTRDYEYAWYGGFDINEDFYRSYYQMTQTIQQQLKH